MNKKMTALLLALLLCGSLAACGGQTANPEDGKKDEQVVDAVKDEKDKEKDKDKDAETDKPEQEDKEEQAAQDKPETGAAASGSTSKPQSSGGGTTSKPASGGSTTSKPSTGSTSSSQTQSKPDPEPAPAPQPQPEPEPEPAPEPAKPTAAQASGYIGSSASALESALGAPSSKSYSPSCMGEGEDGVWSYSGFTVYTYRENGVETVEAVA